MRTITAEFRSPPRPTKSAWAILVVLAACSAAAWGWVGWQKIETRRVRAEVVRLEAAAAQARADRERPAPQAAAPWDASARMMLEQAGSRWPEVLAALESVPKGAVTPTALNVNVPAQTATVEVQFADYAGLLDYIAQLNALDATLQWRLVQAQAAPGATPAAPPGASTGSRASIAATLARK